MNTHERSHTLAPALCTSVEKLLSWETENYDTTFHFVDNDLRVTSKTFLNVSSFFVFLFYTFIATKNIRLAVKIPYELYICI
jgi:hypothetical protein